MKDYRYYLRDIELNDIEYQNIIDDIIVDIAYETNIFKKEITFDVIANKKYYDLNSILYMYEKDKNSVLSTSDDYVDNTGDYSRNLLHIIDVRLFDTSKNREFNNKPIDSNVSSIGSDFIIENRSVLKYIGHELKDTEWRRYIAIVSFIPTIDQIEDQRETMIQNALLAGLRFKAQTLYTDQNDQQYHMNLKKIYELELNKLKNIEPMVAYWQNKKNSF